MQKNLQEKLQARIARVQKELKAQNLDAWIVTGTDPHQTEYLPPHWLERQGITGFSGSAGTVVVLQDSIHLWVDSRYHTQAAQETKGTSVEIHKLGLPKVLPYNEWLCENMPAGATVGVDGMTISLKGFKDLHKELVGNGITLQAQENLFLPLWDDRPEPPVNPVIPLDPAYTGESREERLQWIAKELKKQRATGLLVTDQANVGYILNLRGTALPYNPVFEAFLLIEAGRDATGVNDPETVLGKPAASGGSDKADKPDADKPDAENLPQPKATLFIEDSSISAGLASELAGVVKIQPYNTIAQAVANFEGTLIIDPTKAPYALVTTLKQKAKVKEVTPHPITKKKAIKTACEIEKLHEAHRIDGAAMVQFLHWFDTTVGHPAGEASANGGANGGDPAGGTAANSGATKTTSNPLTEWDAMEKIKEIRLAHPECVDESFATIAGYQANGELNHYHATQEAAAPLTGQGLMVFDSGGQYHSGTTDITRTLLVGEPTAEQISDYTAVLKGHIALATAVFPEETYGHQLDTLARKPLWEKALHYRHGTGHGVGFYMNVHEGPMSIGLKGVNVKLEPGMYISNEPGVYKKDKHGIRLENLVLVENRKEVQSELCKWLGFETLTLCPFEKRLIDTNELTADEKDWLNDYHAGVYTELAPLLEESVREWLAEATAEV